MMVSPSNPLVVIRTDRRGMAGRLAIEEVALSGAAISSRTRDMPSPCRIQVPNPREGGKGKRSSPSSQLPCYLATLLLILAATLASGSSDKTQNPYIKGCLYAKNLTNKVRVCGSDDPTWAVSEGICRKSPFDYAEVRIQPGDWESTFFGTWILQVVLSEMLNVPVSLEMGDPSLSVSLYHPTMAFDYHSDYGNYLDAYRNARQFNGDCSQANRQPLGDNNYQTCAHYGPESWSAKSSDVQESVRDGVLEPPQTLDMLAGEGWYIPQFVAKRDPSLLSYLGMQGEANRQKLAETFKRPQTWEQYCRIVSTNNCTTPDAVAQRPPNYNSTEEGEPDRMYVEGLYKGYFLATDKNNCTLNPTTCSGYFVNYPCSWESNVDTQIHYLNISLEPVATPYSQMVEIYRAAKANQENVIIYWWSPELLMVEMMGTEAEFTPVSLPLPTQECVESKAISGQHCAENPEDRLAAPESVCGESALGLRTLMSTTAYTRAHKGGISTSSEEATSSPSHAALSQYELTELQLAQWFDMWNELGDPREAACDWIANNTKYLERIIPRSYPRTTLQKDPKTPLMYTSTTLGGFVALLVLLTMILVYENKHKRALQHAQIEFLGLLLVGSLFIAIGAIIIGAPPTSISCVVEVWFINLGYTLELVPLVVKVAAINHITKVGLSMRRAKIKREFLFGIVVFISILMAIYLVVWTIMDPPQLTHEYELTDTVNEEGETVVLVLDICASESMMWRYVSVGWNGFLLLCTTILAIQMTKVEMKGFCETPTLALLVYSHMVFVLLRLMTYLLASEDVSQYSLTKFLSMIFSADTAATIIIYFLPKFLAKEEDQSMYISASSFHSVATFNPKAPPRPREDTASSATGATMIQKRKELGNRTAAETDETSPTLARDDIKDHRRRHRSTIASWIETSIINSRGSEGENQQGQVNKGSGGLSLDLPSENDCNDDEPIQCNNDAEEEENGSKIEIDPLLSMKEQLEQTQQRNVELEKQYSELEKENANLKIRLLDFMCA